MQKCQNIWKERHTRQMTRPVLMYGPETWTVIRREEGLLERTDMRMLQWLLGVSLKDKKRNEVIRKMLGGMHYWQNTRGQIEMVRSCDEKRGRKLHEKNYDGRGQRTLQSRTAEKAMGRHDTARHEVSPIKERTYWLSKEVVRGRIRVADHPPAID